jgi:hypothetical protein
MNTKMKAKQLKLGIAAIVCIIAISVMAMPATANYAGDHPLTVYEHAEIEGGLVYETVTDGSAYTVLPCKVYPQDPDYGLTQTITISIPDCAVVKTARLYNYNTWSTSDNDTTGVPGVPAEAELALTNAATGETWTRTCVHGYTDAQRPMVPNPINSTVCPSYPEDVVQYWDSKGQGYVSKTYDYPSGTFAWNVTDLITGSGTYVAKIENADSTPTGMRPGYPYYPDKYRERFATYGFGLLIVYEMDEGPVVEYWVTEGCDMLYNKTAYGYETAENATTKAVFAGPEFELEDIVSAELITVVSASNYGIYDMNMVLFNDVEVGASTAVSDKAIGLDSFGVLDLLSEEQNIADIQDREDYETAHNAFLVVESPIPANVTIEPETLNLQSNGQWVTAYIELPVCYCDVADINASTVYLNDTIPAVTDPQYSFVTDPDEYLTDHDGDGILERMVKFDRAAVIEYLETIDFESETGSDTMVELTVTGNLFDGTAFKGCDTVWVITPVE